MEGNKKTAMSISSLVLGIISIITALFYYLSIPTGILAIVFGAISTNKSKSKLGRAGLITGIVGVSICVFLYISIIIIISLS